MRDLILQLSKSSIYSTKPWQSHSQTDLTRHDNENFVDKDSHYQQKLLGLIKFIL